MFRRLLQLAVLILAGAIGVSAQSTITGSGHVFEPDGTAPPNGRACFTLQNYKPNMPRVVGIALLSNLTSFCIAVDGSTGVFTTPIYKNSDITPANTYWRLEIYTGGILRSAANYTVTGASFNFDTATPINTVATVAGWVEYSDGELHTECGCDLQPRFA